MTLIRWNTCPSAIMIFNMNHIVTYILKADTYSLSKPRFVPARLYGVLKKSINHSNHIYLVNKVKYYKFNSPLFYSFIEIKFRELFPQIFLVKTFIIHFYFFLVRLWFKDPKYIPTIFQYTIEITWMIVSKRNDIIRQESIFGSEDGLLPSYNRF